MVDSVLGVENYLSIMKMKRGRAGIAYEDTELGEGGTAERGCTVEVEYSLFLNRGGQVQKDTHYTFHIGERRVIAGLESGVEGMRAGGKRRIRVGPHLAYGENGVPATIPANGVLEFRVTLLSVQSNESASE
ncbi:MAG: FKBP-type peptidyl-prolyl cis-trans isomerase [Aeromicrobium sp.]|nr:FKBP-type peptidyl-prolyl cis-trans isomerase [Burkholderiales bacterium]